MKLENFIVISIINMPLGLSPPSPRLGALIPCVHSQKTVCTLGMRKPRGVKYKVLNITFEKRLYNLK